MAFSSPMSRLSTKRRPSLPVLTPGMVAIACGILFGLGVLTVSALPMRWLVYMLAGVVVGVITLAGHVRRQLMAYFIVALSLNVHYYITQPEPPLFLGYSAPRWFSIPLVLLPAAALAVPMLADWMAGRRKLAWGLPVSKCALFVIGTATLSTMLSLERRFGIYAVVELLQYFFIFLVSVNIIRSEEDLALVIRCLLITLAIQSSVFFIETAWGVTFTMTGQVSQGTDFGLVRAGGTVGTTPSGFAIFVEPLLFTTFALWRTRDSGVSRGWVGCLAAIGTVALILTLNRTSWVTLLLGTSLIEILCRRRGIARRLSGGAVLSMVGVGILGAVVVIPLILPRLHADHEDDWNIRRNLMRIAIRMIIGNPIVGVGPGAYTYHLREYAPADVLAQWLWVVHNEYLLTWAERGLLGFVAWLAWMRSGFRQAILATTSDARQFQALGIGCTVALAGLCWEYTLNMYPPFSCYALWWCLFGVLVAGNNIYAKPERSAESKVESPRLRLRGEAA
jgi:hypothetical protein